MFGPPRLLEYFSINPSSVNLQEDRLGGGGVGKLLEEGAKRLEGTANSSRGPELIKKKQSETEDFESNFMDESCIEAGGFKIGAQ